MECVLLFVLKEQNALEIENEHKIHLVDARKHLKTDRNRNTEKEINPCNNKIERVFCVLRQIAGHPYNVYTQTHRVIHYALTQII